MSASICIKQILTFFTTKLYLEFPVGLSMKEADLHNIFLTELKTLS